MAATIIAGSGFSQFYSYRTANALQAENTLLSNADSYSEFDHNDIQKEFVSESEGVKTACLAVSGMSCAACAWLLENYLKTLAGVTAVSVQLTEQRLNVSWDAANNRLSEIMAAISRLGYAPRPYLPAVEYLAIKAANNALLQRMGVAGLLMMQIGLFAIAMYLGNAAAIDTTLSPQTLGQSELVQHEAGQSGLIQSEHAQYFKWASFLLALPLVFYCAMPFFQAAIRGVVHGHPGMDLPVALAITIAFTASVLATISGVGEVYYDSIAMFCFLLLLGRYLDQRARQSAGLSSLNMSSQLPLIAQRVSANGDFTPVPVSRLQTGDQVLVKAGEMIPCDAIVIAGESAVNEASFTGESFPRQVQASNAVLAGTLNIDHPLTLSVEATGIRSRFAQLLALIDRAAAEKSPVELLANKIASRFVIAVLLLASATALYWWYVDTSYLLTAVIAVLIVSCPCALSLATPVAMTVARHRLKQRGFLATRANAIEGLSQADTIVFDKTGTLTTGDIRIANIELLGSDSAELCLQLAASLELQSEHPIAHAFQFELSNRQKQSAYTKTKPVDDYCNYQNLGVAGRVDGQQYYLGSDRFIAQQIGVSSFNQSNPPDQEQIQEQCMGKSVVLYCGKTAMARFSLHDPIRDDAYTTVNELKAMGIELIILSGDSVAEVSRVGRALGIKTCFAEQSPEEKLCHIRNLQGVHKTPDVDKRHGEHKKHGEHKQYADGKKLLVVGDGLNDVPVLAAANTSIAVANATDLAKAKADCFLLHPELYAIVEAINYAQKVKTVIRQNIIWAISYNLLAVPCAAMGLVPPWLAAIGMSLSSLVVLFNSLRLRHLLYENNAGQRQAMPDDKNYPDNTHQQPVLKSLVDSGGA